MLIDTPPELRLQLIAAGIDRVDAVLFTHDHADHTHGIDDLRAITVRRDGAAADVRLRPRRCDELAQKFRYIFDDAHAAAARHVEAARARARRSSRACRSRSATSTSRRCACRTAPSRSSHIASAPLAYVTDAKTLPPDAIDAAARRAACW